MYKIISLIKRLSSVALALLLFLLSGTGVYAQASFNDIIFPYYSDKVACGPNTSSGVSNNKIYVIGDSLTVGMRDSGGLRDKLTEKGWSVQDIEATSGDTVSKALPKIDTDAEFVKNSGVVVVALGTNTENDFAGKINEMITKIRATGFSANGKIFWVNAYTKAANYDAINSAIQAQSQTLNYSVIDWKKEATTNPAPYPFTQEGVHHTGVGYSAKSTFLVNALGAPIVSANTGAPTGADTEAFVFWSLVAKGLTIEQASGVVGNMWAESGVNPRRVQSTPTPEGDSDTPTRVGYGLVQWTPGTKILPAASRMNKSPGDLQFQVDLLWEQLEGKSEIPEKAAGDHLKQQKTVADAAVSFMEKYERPGIKKTEKRIQLANQVFQKFSGQTPPAGITVPSGGGSADCTGAASGTAGSVIGDFVVYNQYDPKWKDKPYGSSTVAESGCGPSSIAMIVSTIKKSTVTPDMVAEKYSRFYVPGAGSSWGLMTTAPTEYGLTSTDIGTDMNRATQELRNGGYIIATGRGAKPFTSGGHILVLRGITDSGKILIGDSGHRDTSDKEWETSQLVGSIRNMWVVR